MSPSIFYERTAATGSVLPTIILSTHIFFKKGKSNVCPFCSHTSSTNAWVQSIVWLQMQSFVHSNHFQSCEELTYRENRRETDRCTQ